MEVRICARSGMCYACAFWCLYWNWLIVKVCYVKNWLEGMMVWCCCFCVVYLEVNEAVRFECTKQWWLVFCH